MADEWKCDWCKRWFPWRATQGLSSVYCPGGPDYLLCERHWFAEEEIIDLMGTNVHPDLLDRYRTRRRQSPAAAALNTDKGEAP